MKPSSHRKKPSLSLRLHNLVAGRNQLLDLFILVLQQPQSKRNIVPLPLRLASLQPRRQLGRQLSSMFILWHLAGAYMSTVDSPSR